MNIEFTGKFKSLTSFQWNNIPDFVIITGPNGSGKSQLLDLIHKSATAFHKSDVPLKITGKNIPPHEVIFLKVNGNYTIPVM